MTAAAPEAVRVTTALAEGGLLFVLGRGPGDRPAWTVRLQPDPSQQATTIQLIVEEQGKFVQVVAAIEKPYDDARARELLRVNARLVFAKVALAPDGSPVVATQLPVDLVTRASLLDHLGAVQFGVDVARKVLSGTATADDVFPAVTAARPDKPIARKKKRRRAPART